MNQLAYHHNDGADDIDPLYRHAPVGDPLLGANGFQQAVGGGVYKVQRCQPQNISCQQENGVDDAGNKTGEQVSCRLHNDRRKPLSSLRHWYRPIRVRIPATNRAGAAKIRMMGKKTGTMEMSSTGSACYTVFRPAAAFG